MNNTEMLNNQFYPTPPALIARMWGKVQGSPEYILEPSAGTGSIIEYITEKNSSQSWHMRDNLNISAIEIDDTMQATLRGKGIKVIDSDFLNFAGPDKFDLIIANPPFNKGAEHLLKAINILFSGEIVFLLNAETLRNPCSNTRKELTRRLDELGADIEYLNEPFKVAERSAAVDVALVYIKIERHIETELFNGVTQAEDVEAPKLENAHELTTGRMVEELVADYNRVVEKSTETIIEYYRNSKHISKYILLRVGDDSETRGIEHTLNKLLRSVRADFWQRTLELKEVKRQLTKKKQQEFEQGITRYSSMDFTEHNIRQFVLNLLKGYTDTLTEATLEIFDMFTRHGYNSESIYEKNIHYFNGWKTNSAFKVGKKVIIPVYGSYDGAFTDSYSGRWKLNWNAEATLRDIDIVMNYFDGFDGEYDSINAALERAFNMGTGTAESTYFHIKAHKKGTLHLTFKDPEILRRFNLAACLGKGWLPPTYGQREFKELSHVEQTIVKQFEGEKSYTQNLGTPVFGESNLVRLVHEERSEPKPTNQGTTATSSKGAQTLVKMGLAI